MWVIKTDSVGDTLWTQTQGGGGNDVAWSIQQTADSGYIVIGNSMQPPNGVQLILYKTDANGDTLWTKAYGGAGFDAGYDIKQTPDGGYIIAGESASGGYVGAELWLLKTDAYGDTLWT